MSFLNPVSEPVLRFSSTDADAPQINYNARTAGDIKAVLKACLVTGYGAKASAGWSIVNEVDHVAEFVSPSAAMSDYRLGIDDSTTSKTTWYYQYQDARTNPAYNAPVKAFSYVDKAHASNGWQLFATERGIVLIEIVQSTVVNKLSTRVTYWGAVKPAIPINNGKNICFFNIGHNATISMPSYFYKLTSNVHAMIDSHTSVYMSAATSNMLLADIFVLDTSNVDLVSPIYIASKNQDAMLGQLPPVLSKIVNNSADCFGVSDDTLDGRSVISVCAPRGVDGSFNLTCAYSRTFLICTDYWEY